MTEIRNRTFDEIGIGDHAEIVRTLTHQDILAFAGASGHVSPAQLDRDIAAGSMFRDVIGHGLWTGTLVSAVLGTKLPGPGTVYTSQSFRFLRPVHVNDTVTASVRVRDKDAGAGKVILDCVVRNQNGEDVLAGEAEVIAPREPITIEAPEVPAFILPERGERLIALIRRAQEHPPIRVAVVHPVNKTTLIGALAARDDGTIEPVLIGPRGRIEAAGREAGLSLAGLTIIDTPHSHAAGARAAELAGGRDVDAIMKGALHTDEVLSPVIDRAYGLRTERRLSHVFVMDAPSYHKLLLITDAAVNIQPDLAQKADILRNAITLARALGVDVPKAAILSAIETVNGEIASTVDAASLCKMADRGQIEGGLVEGPLAFDNAISRDAAKLKGLTSEVAGDPDILVVPDLESGNIMAKQLDYLGGAVAAGIVLGARVPVILTSRAEGRLPRRASCALASLLINGGRQP